MAKVRISKFAGDNVIRSVDVIRTLRIIAPDLNVRSASSTVEINEDNQIFWSTVADRATFMDLRSI